MEILRVEKLTDERWLNLFAAAFRHNDHTGRWLFASRKAEPHAAVLRADAVVMVPLLHAPGEPPRLVFVREFRIPIGAYMYGLPAGLLEEGETIETTVRREMLEETGYDVTAIKRISPLLYSSAGLTDEAVALVFLDAHAPQGDLTLHLEGAEDLEVVLLDYAAACALCDDPAIRIDAKAWAVLYLYQLLGRFV